MAKAMAVLPEVFGAGDLVAPEIFLPLTILLGLGLGIKKGV